MSKENIQECLDEQVVFVGETLGPLFLEDPKTGTSGPLLEALASMDVAKVASEWPFVPPDEACLFLTEMKDGLAEGISEDLIWEFRRLFVGPFKKPAPPYGSVYTDKECVMFGEATLELRQWMRQKGIKRLGDESEPEDHIGFLLIMCSWIAKNRPELLGEFLSLHVLTWSSHFLEELAEAAEHSFYHGLALLAKASLEGLQDELSLEVEYPRYYR